MTGWRGSPSVCAKLQGLELDAIAGTVEVLAGEPIPSLARRAAQRWTAGPGVVGWHPRNRQAEPL